MSGCSDSNPIQLNFQSGVASSDGVAVSVLGWGATSYSSSSGQSSTSSILQEAVTSVDTSCYPWDVAPADVGTITSSMMCTRAPHASGCGPCHGDSGGPLIIKGSDASMDVQVGVVSFGYECPDTSPHVTSVYARVSTEFSWINATLNEITSCSSSYTAFSLFEIVDADLLSNMVEVVLPIDDPIKKNLAVNSAIEVILKGYSVSIDSIADGTQGNPAEVYSGTQLQSTGDKGIFIGGVHSITPPVTVQGSTSLALFQKKSLKGDKRSP